MTKKGILKEIGISPYMVFRLKNEYDEGYYYNGFGCPYHKGHIYWAVSNVVQEKTREIAFFVSKYRGVMQAPSTECKQRKWIEEVLLKEYDMVYQGRSLTDAIDFMERQTDQERIGE